MRMDGFDLRIARDYEAMSGDAAEWLVEQIQQRPDLLLCLATGSSPTRTYELLVQRIREGAARFDWVRALKLDEWAGLAMDDPATCECYLEQHLLGPLNVAHYQGFRSDTEDPQEECRRIDQWLASQGPIDVCVLGLGINGHLGLNEPGSGLHVESHVARLSDLTLQHPMLTATAQRPSLGMTLGMGQIMRSKRVLLLVSGRKKAEQMKRLMQREIRTQFPASMLWMHPNVTCFCDKEAAEAIAENRDGGTAA